MINKELIDIAISASKNWGGTKSEPKLIKTRENIVMIIKIKIATKKYFFFTIILVTFSNKFDFSTILFSI